MLSDDFEVKGEWWLPEFTDNKCWGIFRYSESDNKLELDGAFERINLADAGTLQKQLQKHSYIYGLSDDFQRLTLVGITVMSQALTMSGNLGTTTEYSARYVIVGTHAQVVGQRKQIELTEVQVFCSGMASFVNLNSPFRVANDVDGTQFNGLTVNYRQPPASSWRIEPCSTTLDFETDAMMSLKGMSHCEIIASTTCIFRPDHPQGIEWFIEKARQFCFPLTLVTDEKASELGFRIRLTNDDRRCWLLCRPTNFGHNQAEREGSLFLFHFDHLAAGFEGILRKWFSANDVMWDVIYLIMDAHRNRHSIEARFLLLAQAIEVLSRATRSSEYMPEEEYDEVASKLIQAIPSNVGKDHRAALTSRIKFGNEHSLRKRIQLLVESLSQSARDVVCKDPAIFARGISETRNHFTHFTDELRSRALDGAALYWAGEKLLVLARILLLKHLGIKEDIIVKRLKEHPQLMQTIWLARQHPDCRE